MHKLFVGCLAALSLVVAMDPAGVAAEPSPSITAYRITCDSSQRPPFIGGSMLPQPWSSSYQVPDVSDRGPGAFVSHLELTDNRGLRFQYLRPSGVIEAREGLAWMGAGLCVAAPNQLPVGELLITKVEGRGVGIFGYAYDPDSDAVVQVYATVDGRPRPRRFAADWRWTAQPHWSARADDRGVLVLLDGLDPGEHRVCLYGEDGVGGTDVATPNQSLNANLGCVQVVVK
jgi:hypothetical protein